MAILAPGLSGITFEDYFIRRYGLTKDLAKVKLYYQALKDTKPLGSSGDIRKLLRIVDFDWSKCMNEIISIKVAREKGERRSKIVGFLSYGKVLLQDIDDPRIYIEANPDEIIKIVQ